MLGTTKDDHLKNRMLFGFGRSVMNIMLRRFVNKKRAKFGLPPISDIWDHWVGDNIIVACDKELNAARDGVAFHYTQTGFMILPSNTFLPPDVVGFLDSGKPPVYIGFGSNPIENPEKYTTMFTEVRDITGQRLIISKGWADLPSNDTQDILFVDEMPFDLLFPRLAAAIYH